MLTLGKKEEEMCSNLALAIMQYSSGCKTIWLVARSKKILTVRKVDTYSVTYSVCCVRFSIRVFSNLELLQKRSISHAQKNKNKITCIEGWILRETNLTNDCHSSPLVHTGISRPCRQHVTCVGKKGIRMDLKNVIAKNRKKN
jgi:hypothetical protein